MRTSYPNVCVIHKRIEFDTPLNNFMNIDGIHNNLFHQLTAIVKADSILSLLPDHDELFEHLDNVVATPPSAWAEIQY